MVTVFSKHISAIRNHTLNTSALLVFLAPLLLTACSLLPKQETPDSQTQSNPISLEQILSGENFIVYLHQSQLQIVDPEYSHPISLVPLNPEQIPLTHKLDQFLVSPSHQYIAWYSPKLGIQKLNLNTNQISTIRQPSPWLDQNPYLEMHPSRDTLYFIDNQGTELISIELETDQTLTTPIPHPFGNKFRIAPNGNSIIYIAGFDQTLTNPEYMLTSISGDSPIRFSTSAPINKRSFVEWSLDSSRIILLDSASSFTQLDAQNPTNPQPSVDLSKFGTISKIHRLDSNLYINTSDNSWHIYDLDQEKIVVRTTTEIATDIHRPTFYPWHDQKFLIEETIILDPQQFNRLWLSDHQGIKKLIIDKYHQINIQTQTPSI